MEPHPDDLTATDDLTLVQAARCGDRLAFGVLYLRHHAAAWRIACVASRFSPDAELAVIEGFTRVFSALPVKSEEFEEGGVTFRPYLLACVRQAALARARAAGRAEPGRSRPGPASSSPPSPAPLAGLAPDGEVVLSSMEHHVARAALAALPERTRMALWLSDVEAMTPGEVAGILGSDREVVTALAAEARAGVRLAQDSAQGHHEVRADCRFTVDNLGAYHAGVLDPKKGVLVRSHLDLCPPCRMRLGELANAPATLAATVPAAPLLGGEAQHHWLSSATGVRPAERLLPPGAAAAAHTWHLPHVLRPTRDHRTRRMTAVTGAVPGVARKVGRRARSAAPALMLIVAWLGVMLSLPQLMQPETAPGPGGLALPAVQAYVPTFMPGAATPSSNRNKNPRPAPPGPSVGVAGDSSELAAPFTSESGRAGAGSPGRAAQPTVGFIPTAVSPRARSPQPVVQASQPAAVTAAAEAVPAVVTNAVPIVPLLVTGSSPVTPAVDDGAAPPAKPANADKGSKPKKDSTKSDRGSTPGKKTKQKDSKAGKDDTPRQEAKPERKSRPEQDSTRSKGSERKQKPASRPRIVTA